MEAKTVTVYEIQFMFSQLLTSNPFVELKLYISMNFTLVDG